MLKGATKLILEILSEGVISSTAFLLAMIEAGYGTSANRLNRKFYEKYDQLTLASKSDSRRAKSYRTILWRLKRDGLIVKSQAGWSITALGLKKRQGIKAKLSSKKYFKEGSKLLKIVIFDIPEKERAKRRWLRGVLGELGFTLLQKSVWAGKMNLPREFMDDLRDLKLLNYVDIFAVTKSGSIEHLG